MRINLRHKQQHFAIDVQHDGGSYRVTIDGSEHLVEICSFDAAALLVVDGRAYRVHLTRQGRERLLAVAGETYCFTHEVGATSAHHVTTTTTPEITSPMPGKVLQVFVQAGDHVAAGDTLLILEAMKMENRLTVEAAATVTGVHVAAGDMVGGGQTLLTLQYDAAAP